MANPFRQDMVRMVLPPEMGRSVSVGGFAIEADSDMCVDVPRSMSALLISHGLRVVNIVEAVKPEEKKKV